MDIARERSYPTPLANSPLLPMLILSLMRQKNAPKTAEFFNTEYDYIIVGAGSAGSVVASRLSEIPCVNVLLLEAGKPPPYITQVPGLPGYFSNTDLDWTWKTVPQRNTGRLTENRIPVVADLPVGQNLQNSVAKAIYFELSSTIETVESKLSNPRYILEYIHNRSGPLGSAGLMSVAASLKIDQVRPTVDFPDYELVFEEGMWLEEGVFPEVIEQVYGPYEGKPILECMSSLIHPRSRGTVTLNSTDPYDPPIIDPRYFEDPRDMDAIVDGLKVCNRIGTSTELRRIGSVPTRTVYPGCEPFVDDEDAYFRCMLKSFIIPYHTQAGTARMGNANDPKAVVDPQLRVKGVKGLRVADCSVMPFVASEGPNVSAMMVGEKVSDMIKDTIQCKGYRTNKEWWHARDNSRWTEQENNPLFPDLKSHDKAK